MSPLKFIASCKDRLTKVSEKEPLSKISLLLVILFDIFLFFVISDGLGRVSMGVEAPENYAGYECRQLLDTTSLPTEKERDESMLSIVRGYESYRKYDSMGSYSSSSYGNSYSYGKGCETIRKGVSETRWSDREFIRIDTEIESIEKNLQANSIEQSTLRSNYDTQLLEKIAQQPETGSITRGSAESAKADLDALVSTETTLRAKKEALVQAALALPSFQALRSNIVRDGKIILLTYEKLSFWYPVKTFGVELLFLLPILFVMIFWVRFAIGKGWEIQTLVSAHVIAVLSVFGLIKAVVFVVDILPHKLIQRVINALEALNLIAVWYYVVVIFAIACTLGLVYFIQKKILNRKRLEAKRVSNGQCRNCSIKLFDGQDFCVNCGTEKYAKCPKCKKETLAGAAYCDKCGNALGDLD